MAEFKPTLSKPVSTQSKKVVSNFVPVMNQVHQINTNPMLEEVDGMLGEAEQSLKKKIFRLDKMKTLVFGDPKLSAVYDEMALNGGEKYGYHYSETIMNIIFNDYILNSSKYLQKYKMAIPAKDGRRDKSGINKLKKDGAKKFGKTGTNIVEPDLEKEIEPTVAETDSGSSGAFAPALGYQDKTLNEFGTSGSNGVSATGQYSGPSAWSEKGDLLGHSEPYRNH